MSRFRDDDHAVAQSHMFAIAVGLLVSTTGVLFGATSDMGRDTSASDTVDAEQQSAALLDSLLDSDWAWGEDNASLSALRDEDGSLKLEQLDPFRGSDRAASSNGMLDYDEARTAMGVPVGDDFHVRIVPVELDGVTPDLSGIRTAYIADWQTVASITVGLSTDEQMMAEARAQVDLTMDARTIDERARLAAIGVDYDDQAHLTMALPTLLVELPTGVTSPLVSRLGDLTLLEGDVYYDEPEYIKNALPSRMGDYDAIVIGSGVDPAALMAGSLEDQLAKHVLQGGLLIVLDGGQGSDWLAPIYEELNATANQEPASPDPRHPLLRWPYEYDWESIDEGTPWDDEAHDDDHWQKVLLEDEGIHLMVSQQGSAGDGMAILSSFMPGYDEDAGEAFLANAFSYYARQDAHLDFGETAPDGAAIASATRLVYGLDDADNPVPLHVTLRYW